MKRAGAPSPVPLVVLHSTLTAFAHAILRTPWFGKEREAVSYYAFGFLAKACNPNALLFDPGQLAIEGRIPGTRSHGKKQVCKDLVIWPAPGANCWEGPNKAVHAPLAIIEWKADRSAFYVEAIKGEYPWPHAFFIVVSREHIKCLTYKQLAAGKAITPTCTNLLIKRGDLGLDKKVITKYLTLAKKFFTGV